MYSRENPACGVALHPKIEGRNMDDIDLRGQCKILLSLTAETVCLIRTWKEGIDVMIH